MIKLKPFIKSLLIVVLILTLNSSISGQSKESEVYTGAITFGLYHSFNLTTITGSFPELKSMNLKQETKLTSPRFTFDVGMTMDYYIAKQLSVQMDLLFTYSGGHFISTRTIYNEVGKIEQDEWFTYATSYFQMPLAIVFYPKEQIYFSGGGYIATLIHSHKYHVWYDNTSQPIKDINNFDYGLSVGAGFNMSYVKIGFQYNYGIANIINNSNYNLHHSDYKLVIRWKFSSDIRNRKRGY
jgi:hypothetical protein